MQGAIQVLLARLSNMSLSQIAPVAAPKFVASTLEISAQALAFYGFSTPKSARFVTGGLQHRLLRVETDSQNFALKILAPRAVSTCEKRAQIERGESLAQIAAQNGIPALCALPNSRGEFLSQIGENWVALYPWKDGETLPPTAAAPEKCEQMGAFLGRLHALKVRFSEQKAPFPEAFENGHFESIFERAQSQNQAWAPRLEAVLAPLERANALAMGAQLDLRENWVIGHLDFDQKNVLWDGENPTILDWEAAKAIHPALETLGAALSWAGQSAGDAQFESFAAFLNAYLAENALQKLDLERAVDGVLGKWLIWLEFNLARLLEPQIAGTPEAKIAFDAAFHALDATLKLQNDGEKYRNWLARLAL